jgi:ribosomal protein S27AE
MPKSIISYNNYVGEVKQLITLRSIEPFTNDPNNKKYCVNCGDLATQIAYFHVDGTTTVERYCDRCADSVKFAT